LIIYESVELLPKMKFSSFFSNHPFLQQKTCC
jgi:hypothetical protein